MTAISDLGKILVAICSETPDASPRAQLSIQVGRSLTASNVEPVACRNPSPLGEGLGKLFYDLRKELPPLSVGRIPFLQERVLQTEHMDNQVTVIPSPQDVKMKLVLPFVKFAKHISAHPEKLDRNLSKLTRRELATLISIIEFVNNPQVKNASILKILNRPMLHDYFNDIVMKLEDESSCSKPEILTPQLSQIKESLLKACKPNPLFERTFEQVSEEFKGSPSPDEFDSTNVSPLNISVSSALHHVSSILSLVETTEITENDRENERFLEKIQDKLKPIRDYYLKYNPTNKYLNVIDYFQVISSADFINDRLPLIIEDLEERKDHLLKEGTYLDAAQNASPAFKAIQEGLRQIEETPSQAKGALRNLDDGWMNLVRQVRQCINLNGEEPESISHRFSMHLLNSEANS